MRSESADNKNNKLLNLYSLMAFSRALDEIYGAYDGHWHGLEGEEAVIAGAYYGLRKTDFLAPHYRGTPVAAYAKGADLHRLFAGMLAKKTGYSHGRHRSDICGPPELNMVGLYTGSLGPSLGYAVGAALAAKLDGRDDIALAVFGDGTSSRGDCHEAMNFAATQQLGVVFLCQNNQFAISTKAQSGVAGKIADRAIGFAMPGVQVDGNNVLEVRTAVEEAIARARAGEGPSLIEALTYRVAGHFYSDTEDYRDAEIVNAWRERDPISQFATYLINAEIAGKNELLMIAGEQRALIEKTFELAKADPAPDSTDLGFDSVYAGSSHA